MFSVSIKPNLFGSCPGRCFWPDSFFPFRTLCCTHMNSAVVSLVCLRDDMQTLSDFYFLATTIAAAACEAKVNLFSINLS